MSRDAVPAAARQWSPRRRPCAAAALAAAGLVPLLLLVLGGCEVADTAPPVPVVTISAEEDSVTAGGELYFSIRADPAPRTDLTVGVTISYGGCEVARSSKSVTIAAGDSSTKLTVETGDGAAGCTVTATIADGQGYRVGRAADASAAVDVTGSTDLPPPPAPAEPVVTIAADRSSVVEGEGLSFTVTAAPPPASALEVTVSWSDPDSFLAESVPRTVTVPTSSSTVKLRAATTDDSADEPDGVVTATISGGSGYTIGSPASAPVTVTDNDATSTTADTPLRPLGDWACSPLPEDKKDRAKCPGVSIHPANAEVIDGTPATYSYVTEGTPAVFTLTAYPAPLSALTVSLSWTRFDVRRVGDRPDTVSFDAGSGTASVTVETFANEAADGDSDLGVLITEAYSSPSNPYFDGGYDQESSVAAIIIEDDDD